MIVGQHYCVATEDGTIVALDLEHKGQLAWQYRLDAHLTTHALASDGERIFVGGVDGCTVPVPGQPLLALDAQTGQAAWRYPTQAHSLSAAAVAQGVVYVSSSDGLLHAVSASDGQPHWIVKHPNWGMAAPAVGAGILCAGGRGATMAAYAIADPATGWSFTTDKEGWFATRPVIANGSVFAWCWDGNLYAFAARDGQLLWQYKGERGQGLTSPPYVAGKQVFVGSRVYRNIDGARQRTYALLSLRVDDSSEIWRFHTPAYVSAPIAVYDDILFCSTEDGSFYALDVSSGQQLWHLHTDAPVITLPLVYNEQVIIATRPGEIIAIRWQPALKPELAAPEVYLQQDDQLQAAASYALQGDFAAAAQIYAQLDQHEHAAQLYEHAAQRYLENFDHEHAAECQHEVRRYRHQPEVLVVGKPQDTFVEYQWNTLQLRVENTGYGPAYDIQIRFDSTFFDIEGNFTMQRLFPQASEILEVAIRPQREQYGPSVPLKVALTYADKDGGSYEETRRMTIHVVQQGSTHEHATPASIELGRYSLSPEQLRQLRWDTAVLRTLLMNAFTDQEIRDLCFDYFTEVYDRLALGMAKDQMISMVLDYCHRTGQFTQLIDHIRERNPAQYDRFADRLTREQSM